MKVQRARERQDVLPLVLKDVSYARGDARLIQRLSLRVEGGGISVLMGPNGAGKSLTLRLMAGLITPTKGTVRWAGQILPPPHAVGLVFQKPVMLRRLVKANLDHALAAYGVVRDQRADKIKLLLSLAQLDEQADRPARALSGGEQQRLAMVRVLAAQPSLLLLDEPTASLDPHSTHIIEALVRQAADNGIKVVLVTHQRGQAKRMADEIMFIHAGEITEVTQAVQFFEQPKSDAGTAYMEGRLLVNGRQNGSTK